VWPATSPGTDECGIPRRSWERRGLYNLGQDNKQIARILRETAHSGNRRPHHRAGTAAMKRRGTDRRHARIVEQTRQGNGQALKETSSGIGDRMVRTLQGNCEDGDTRLRKKLLKKYPACEGIWDLLQYSPWARRPPPVVPNFQGLARCRCGKACKRRETPPTFRALAKRGQKHSEAAREVFRNVAAAFID